MDQAQQQWLTKLGVATNKHIAFEVKDKRKREVLKGASSQIEAAKDEIRKATTYAIAEKGKLTYSMTETSEQLDELSMREAEARLNEQEKARIEEKRQELAAAAENLRVKLKAAGFNEMEINETITEELYFPLVREKLMPEDLVPDQYSKTQQMLDATNALYEEALKDEEPDEGPDGFAMAKKGIGYAAKIGKGIADIVGTQGLADQAKMAGDIISLTELALTTGVTAAEAISKDQLRGSLSDIVDNIGTILTTAIALDPNMKDVARTVGTIYKAATKTAMIVKCLTDTPPDVEGALTNFADGFNAALAAGSKKVANESDRAKMQASATIVSAAFKAAAKIPAIKKNIQDRDFTGLVNNLTLVGKEAVASGLAAKATLDSVGKTEEEKKAIAAESAKLLQKINDGITAGNLTIATGVAVYSAAVQGEINEAAVNAIEGIGKILETTLKAYAPPEIAKTVSSAYTYTTSAGLIANYMIKGQHGKAIQALGDGFAAAMELCNPDPNDKTFAKVGKSMSTVFKACVSAADIKAAIDAGDYDKAIDLLSAAGTNASSSIQAITTDAPEEVAKDEENLEPDDWDTDEEAEAKAKKKELSVEEAKIAAAKKAALLETRIAKAGTDIAKSGAALKRFFADDTNKKRMQDKLEEQRKKDIEDEVKQEQAEYERMLTLVDEGGDAAADSRSVETLIKQMQRDKLIMDLALKIGTGGLDVAAKFVPGLAIGSCALKLAGSLMAAANRAMALNKWLDNRKDGKTAASVYSSSIENFVSNQQEQFSYYAIKAALQLAQLIGASLTVSGLGAMVGEPLSKAAILAETSADIAKEIFDEVMLQRAWATTKAAFADRKNRKLGLLARKQNPTLAKYSIAWGAVEKKDAIAKKAMNSCGLNAQTLAQKDTNVGVVVKYLETMFPDDRVIRKALPKTAEWQPDEVTLSVKCWVNAKLGGEKHANLVKADTGLIEGSLVAFAQFEVTAAKAQKEKTLAPKLLDDFEVERKRLNGAFGSYAPLLKDGGPHTDMQDIVDQFVALTEVTKATILEMRIDMNSGNAPPPKSGEESVPTAPERPEAPPPLTRPRRK